MSLVNFILCTWLYLVQLRSQAFQRTNFMSVLHNYYCSWIVFIITYLVSLLLSALAKVPILAKWSGCRLETCLRSIFIIRHYFVIIIYFSTIIFYIFIGIWFCAFQHYAIANFWLIFHMCFWNVLTPRFIIRWLSFHAKNQNCKGKSLDIRYTASMKDCHTRKGQRIMMDKVSIAIFIKR